MNFSAFSSSVSHSQEVSLPPWVSNRAVLNKTIRRPKLGEKEVKNLLARRYGSLTDFSQVVARWCDIARATGVHQTTCRKAVNLYHKKGNRFVPVNGQNYAVGRPRKLTAELEAQITSDETL